MNKNEFINKILNIYGRGLEKEAKVEWIKSCMEVLEEDIDYLRFWQHFIREFDCKTTSYQPSCQWLYKESRIFRKKKVEAALEHIRNMPKGDPPPSEFIALREKFLQKSAY